MHSGHQSNLLIVVTAPPIPPPEAGQCHISPTSDREICYPNYEELDTTCTEVGDRTGLVAPPVIPHATYVVCLCLTSTSPCSVRAMAFVPPDNLKRLIRQYYRQLGKHIPKNTTFNAHPFLFVKYQCDYGYELEDEVDMMFCRNKQWVHTRPVCRGLGKRA